MPSNDVPRNTTQMIPGPGRHAKSVKALFAAAVAFVGLQIVVAMVETTGVGAAQLCLQSNGQFGSCSTVPPSSPATTVPEVVPARPTTHVVSNGIDPVPVLSAVGWTFVALGVVGLAATLLRDWFATRSRRMTPMRRRKLERSLPFDRR